MTEEFEAPIMNDAYNQLIDSIKDFTRQMKKATERTINEYNEYLNCGNVITKDMADRIKDKREKLVDINNILKKYT